MGRLLDILRRMSHSNRFVIDKALNWALEALETRIQLTTTLSFGGTETITPGTAQDISNTSDPTTGHESYEHEFDMSVAVNPTDI